MCGMLRSCVVLLCGVVLWISVEGGGRGYVVCFANVCAVLLATLSCFVLCCVVLCGVKEEKY